MPLRKKDFFKRLSRYSDWNVSLRIITIIKRLVNRYQSEPISVEAREKVTLTLIKLAQREAFQEELRLVKTP